MVNLNLNEKKAILHWTSPSSNKLYRGIKKASQNKYLGTKYEIDMNSLNDFNAIEQMFSKQEDNTSSIDIIYRADIIENDSNILLSDEEVFNAFHSKLRINETFELEDIICSFSSNKDTALRTAKLNDKYISESTPVVLFILKKRLSKYLYIAPYSNVEDEEEVMCFGKKMFKVMSIKNELHYVEVIIEEVQNII